MLPEAERLPRFFHPMSTDPETRTSLLVQLADGENQQAWFEFVDLYQPVIFNYARRRGLQEADAHDVVQVVMARVATKLKAWDADQQRGSFRGWLAIAVKNLAIDYFRSQKLRPIHLPELPEAIAPEADFDWEQRRSLFHWAAARVQQEFQSSTWQAFWRTAVLDQHVAQVARELNMTRGAIYVARSRVLARIRQLISQSEFDSTQG